MSLLTPILYARWVLKMNPALFAAAMAGLLACTATLNASVHSARSELLVLRYTVPYAIANVLLTSLDLETVLAV